MKRGARIGTSETSLIFVTSPDKVRHAQIKIDDLLSAPTKPFIGQVCNFVF
ncbi:hypothetical protein [Vibrio sagamiensis]|nr:hypothetical protein [Vibrio sagamiensis]